MTRVLRSSPGFSLIVIAVLALGIGTNTALLSIIDRVLLHPLPVRDLDRLVHIDGMARSGRRTGNAVAESEFFAARVRAFYQTAVWKWQTLVLTGVDNPDYLPALEVSEHLFDMLGAPPQIGRTFLANDFRSSAAPVVVISDKLWRTHFHADAGIAGRQILLGGKGYTVVGVMGAGFFFDRPAYQVWIPYRLDLNPAEEFKHYFGSMARLRPGISLEQAQREVDAVTPVLPSDPAREAGWHVRLSPLAEEYTGPYARTLAILWGAVGLVLLIACANAGNLLLARASERRREFAIRASLGAGAVRLVRQIIGETLTLGIVAGAMGVALSFGFLRLLVTMFPTRLPFPQLDRVSVSIAALVITAGMVIITTLLCAVPACLGLWRFNLLECLNASSRTASASHKGNRTREAMIALEVALSLVLLAGAGLMLRTMGRLLDVHLGFEPQHVLTARVAAPPGLKKNEQVNHYTRMLEEVQVLPGVRSAAITTILPFGNVVATVKFTAEGSIRPSPTTYLREISPGYFRTLGMRLLRGRDFDTRDGAGSELVAIVSDELARSCWPGEDPIGKRLAGVDGAKAGNWSTVVGVVENIKHRSLKTGADAELYFPYTQQLMGANYTSLVMRTEGDPLSLASALSKRIHQMAPDQPVTDISAMQNLVTDSAAEVRFHTLLLEIFAGLALGLAITGIFAVVSYSVTQRAREIGIRSAMGATPDDIVRFTLAIAMRPVVVGACMGLAGAFAAARVLQSELFETAPADPLVFATVLLLLLATALAAAAIPAWRATRIDPAEVLRAE